MLSALAFDQKSVVGVEINGDILDTVNGRYGDFTGHLDRHPKVRFVHDEARSYVARVSDRFDIIQVSLIDTWAATAAGAFVLSENSLYTVEAWRVFLDHLKPNGVLTFSRWFRPQPAEMQRLTALAAAALRGFGVRDPRRHIVIVRWVSPPGAERPEGVGTMLVGRDPFTRQDLAAINAVAERMNFELVLSPEQSIDPSFGRIASAKPDDPFLAEFPVNISAPTDDSPFYFHMLRARDLFNWGMWGRQDLEFNTKAVFVLGVLLAVAPLGFFMGMAFPMGMKQALRRGEALGPWLWGVNGATSVCASVLAVALALTAGISAAFWIGVGCYAVAWAAFAWATARAGS